MTTLLAIETSCDETSAAVVEDGVRVRSNVVASQVDLHRKYGGVVPEIASRAHIERLDSVIEEALSTAGCGSTEMDAIAVTHRPGLVPALIIGLTAAKTLSWAWGKPLVGVDHIHAHAYSPALGGAEPPFPDPPWPAAALIVSGGHTSLFRVDTPTAIHLLGATIDDAAGEAFDKVATILGLPYPGGPEVEKLAREGNPQAIDFPRTMLTADSLDFSFSGIKTAVLYHVHGQGKTSGGLERLSRARLADIAASFQQAVIDVLIRKTLAAVKRTGLSTVVMGGGVAANRTLRTALEKACQDRRLRFVAAPMAYCTDNAAMIAGLGYHLLRHHGPSSLSLEAVASGAIAVRR